MYAYMNDNGTHTRKSCCYNSLQSEGGTIVFEVGVQNYFASRASEKLFFTLYPIVDILMFAFSQTANDVQIKFQLNITNAVVGNITCPPHVNPSYSSGGTYLPIRRCHRS
jgi:hypothetical protein